MIDGDVWMGFDYKENESHSFRFFKKEDNSLWIVGANGIEHKLEDDKTVHLTQHFKDDTVIHTSCPHCGGNLPVFTIK